MTAHHFHNAGCKVFARTITVAADHSRCVDLDRFARAYSQHAETIHYAQEVSLLAAPNLPVRAPNLPAQALAIQEARLPKVLVLVLALVLVLVCLAAFIMAARLPTYRTRMRSLPSASLSRFAGLVAAIRCALFIAAPQALCRSRTQPALVASLRKPAVILLARPTAAQQVSCRKPGQEVFLARAQATVVMQAVLYIQGAPADSKLQMLGQS